MGFQIMGLKSFYTYPFFVRTYTVIWVTDIIKYLKNTLIY